jgi:hypothetical protein
MTGRLYLPPIKYVALPNGWPGRARPSLWKPKRSPFKGHNWSRIERALQEEVGRVNGRDLTIAIDLRSPGHFRNDGGIRSDARPVTSRIVISFARPDGRRLVFPCDAYAFWQDNVWAVHLSLAALRAVDRHGVTQGDQQYEGFAALPPGGGSSAFTVEQAYSFLSELSGVEEQALVFPAVYAMAVKVARAKAHPDSGGTNEKFQKLGQAMKLIEQHMSAEAMAGEK